MLVFFSGSSSAERYNLSLRQDGQLEADDITALEITSRLTREETDKSSFAQQLEDQEKALAADVELRKRELELKINRERRIILE